MRCVKWPKVWAASAENTSDGAYGTGQVDVRPTGLITELGTQSLGVCVPLILIEKLRLQVLVPVTVVTCPILAIENGVNAQSVALNVMAVLFIFDFDDGRMA